MFQIEKGISIPDTAVSSISRATYPFKLMDAGDSVWIDGDAKAQKRAISNARFVGKKDNKTFVFEQTASGVRIWRKA